MRFPNPALTFGILCTLAVAPGVVGQAAGEPASPRHAGSPFENGLGMKFVAVPGTPVLFSIWLTRVRDFEAFVRETGYDATRDVYSLSAKGWEQTGHSWKNPGFAQGADHPACAISWVDAKAFCEWLTQSERRAGRLERSRVYRLPTEAEWIVADGLSPGAKGSPTLYPWGEQWPPPAGFGNYAGEEARDGSWPADWPIIKVYRDDYPRTSPVGRFPPNRYGLYDMSGNLWEWCEDLYKPDGRTRVVRGGAFRVNVPLNLQWAYRGDGMPETRYLARGFRCVLAPEKGQ